MGLLWGWAMKPCTVEGCSIRHWAKGFCSPPYATVHFLRGRVKFLLDGVVQDSPPGAVCVAEFLPDWLNGGKR